MIIFVIWLYFLDVDECTDGTFTCDEHANCHNIEGSYKCQCKEGYSGTGQQCDGNILSFILHFTHCHSLDNEWWRRWYIVEKVKSNLWI